jgi:hypothetical protein
MSNSYSGDASMTTKQQSRESTVLHNLNTIYPGIEEMYIDLHEHPELSMQEVQTSAKVASRLKDAGFEVTNGVGIQELLVCSAMAQVLRSCYAAIWMPSHLKRRRISHMPAP